MEFAPPEDVVLLSERGTCFTQQWPPIKGIEPHGNNMRVKRKNIKLVDHARGRILIYSESVIVLGINLLSEKLRMFPICLRVNMA